MTNGPVPLAAALNTALGLRLADAAEARAWLAAGGWEVLDTWIASHRGDPDSEAGAEA